MGATLRSRAASNWTQSGPAGNSQRPSNLHIICKNSSLNEDHAGLHRRSAGRRTLPRQAAAEAPRLLRGRQLAAAGAEGLQLVAVSDRRTRQLERRQDRDLQRAEASRLLGGMQLAAAGAESLQLRSLNEGHAGDRQQSAGQWTRSRQAAGLGMSTTTRQAACSGQTSPTVRVRRIGLRSDPRSCSRGARRRSVTYLVASTRGSLWAPSHDTPGRRRGDGACHGGSSSL